MKDLDLKLKYVKKEGVSSKTNKLYSFNEIYVVVKNISIRLCPLVGDETGKTIINDYITELEGCEN